jgi:4-carboxymuconolactone decarboxylase
MKPRERILARLALGDDIRPGSPMGREDLDMGAVDARDVALVRLGAMLALDAGIQSLQRAVTDAALAGVTDDEIVCCVVSLVPTLGSARTSAVAPDLAMALGFDLDAALEQR